MTSSEGLNEQHTASRGELTKINLEGCKGCGMVYVSLYNSLRLQIETGWHLLANLQQKKPGDSGLDVVLRVRGRVWGGKLGNKLCPTCKMKGVT